MNRDNLTSPVAAAATSQVKLCPYDEEEQHIWFRLIEAQFAAAGIKSQKLKFFFFLCFFVLQRAFFYFLCTVSGCDGRNQTRNIAVYTWRFAH
jgi:hypothetical protein